MGPKQKIAPTLPAHIAAEIQHYAGQLSRTPTEYLAAIAAKWYADGCPPVTPEEARLRAEKAPKTKAPKAS